VTGGIKTLTESSVVALPVKTSASWPFNPAEEYRELRAKKPVVRVQMASGESVWVVTRYEDVRQVLRDAVRFSSVPPPRPLERPPSDDGNQGALPRVAGFFATCDPPEHARYRRMLASAFTPRKIEWMRPRIEAIVSDLLDAMERVGRPVDLVQSFALPIPTFVICELLGVPVEDRTYFQRLAAATEDLTVPQARLRASWVELLVYGYDLVVAERRDPGDNLVGTLVREHGDELSDEELVGIFGLILLAGYDPPASMLALGALLLMQHPDDAKRIVNDPDAVAPAVEELLRYLSVVFNGQVRTATEDVTLGGQHIAAGDFVMCSLPSGNRDESFQSDADRFNIDRGSMAHLAFGHGPHHCLGRQLARLELEIALRALFTRFPSVRPAMPFQKIRFRANTPVHGVRELPVVW
jgi:cytochrome P450